MTKTIDVHWHHVPKAFADAVVSGDVPVAGQVVTKDDGRALVKLDNGFKQPLPGFLTDPATIVADLDAAGIDVACASIAPPLSHLDCDPQIALGVSRAAFRHAGSTDRMDAVGRVVADAFAAVLAGLPAPRP